MRPAMNYPSANANEVPREVDSIGMDIVEENTRDLFQRRLRKGECPTCGARTHKTKVFGKKTPLTEEGKVLNGQCLRCNPVEGYQMRPAAAAAALQQPSQTAIPFAVAPGHDIILNNDDDSVVSGITMDGALLAQGSSHNWHSELNGIGEEDEEDFPTMTMKLRRPEASVGDDDLDLAHLGTRPYPSRWHPEERMDRIGYEIMDSPQPGKKSRRGRQPQQAHISPSRSPIPSRRNLSPHRDNMIPRRYPENVNHRKREDLNSSGSTFSFPQPIRDEAEFCPDQLDTWKEPNKMSRLPSDESKREIEAPASLRSDPWQREDPYYTRNSNGRVRQKEVQGHGAGQSPGRAKNFPVPDAPRYTRDGVYPTVSKIIQSLHSGESNSLLRAQAFRTLSELIWDKGDEAKIMIQRNQGIETLVESMWNAIGDPEVQIAATELLFALSASLEGTLEIDVLTGESARNAVDALLISMQTNISVESIQRSGCGALRCLAAASHENRTVDDGTLSGAVLCVVTAMDAHRKSLDVQKWGLSALYCQCVLSANAENNQMSLAKGSAEAGGVNVIYRAMNITKSDLASQEIGCRLYWSLSFSDEIVGIMTETPEPVIAIMDVLALFQDNKDAAEMEEAAYGALANIARVKETHSFLREAKTINRVFHSMDRFVDSEGVNIEACALLANLTETEALREAAQSYGVEKICFAMEKFPQSPELQEEAMRALLCLTIDSEQTKVHLSSDKYLKLIMTAIDLHRESLPLLETAFALTGSIFARQIVGPCPDCPNVTDLVVKCMREKSEKWRLQEIMCLVLRNLACRDRGLHGMRFHFFPSLVNIMKIHADSRTIQLNACCVMWNLAARIQEEDESATDKSCTDRVVAVLQAHAESAEAVEMACGALWRLIAGSEERKRSLAESGGVDFVKMALLMHGQSPTTLEMACGVLSCLSGTLRFVGALAQDDGLSFVVETMINNPNSLSLLGLGCIILRNVVLDNGDNAAYAAAGISRIIGAMAENLDDIDFQREACTALWAMAVQSDDCKQRIIDLNGRNILMAVEHGDTDTDVREAAHKAIEQLS